MTPFRPQARLEAPKPAPPPWSLLPTAALAQRGCLQALSQVQRGPRPTIRRPHLDTCSAHVPGDPSLDGSLGPPLTEESRLSTWPGAPHAQEGGERCHAGRTLSLLSPSPAEQGLGIELVRGTACPQGALEKLSVGLSLMKRNEQLFTLASMSQRGCAGPWGEASAWVASTGCRRDVPRHVPGRMSVR